MSHDGNCYCPNCDRSFDRDGMDAVTNDRDEWRKRAEHSVGELVALRERLERLEATPVNCEHHGMVGPSCWRCWEERFREERARAEAAEGRLAWALEGLREVGASDDPFSETRYCAVCQLTVEKCDVKNEGLRMQDGCRGWRARIAIRRVANPGQEPRTTTCENPAYSCGPQTTGGGR